MPRAGAAMELTASSTPAPPAAGRSKLYPTSAGPWAALGASGRARLIGSGAHVVTDYGAIGNGTADDAPAIQAALNAAGAEPGGRVMVPPGTYRIASELEITGPTWLELSPGATIRRGSAAMQYMIRNFNASYAPTGYGGRGGITITGGVWDADGGNLANPTTVIIIAHADRVRIENVTVRNVRDWHAVELCGVRAGRVIDCTFEGFTVATSGREISEAVQLDLPTTTGAIPGIGAGALDGTPCTDIVVSGCTARRYGTLGSYGRLVGSHNWVDATPQTNIRVIGNHAEYCNDYAYRAYHWQDVVISGNTAINCNGGVAAVVPTAATVAPESVSIVGNTIRAPGTQNNGTAVVSGAISLLGILSSGVPLRQATVTGNIIRNFTNGVGIEVTNTADSVVGSNIIRTGGASSTGILVTGGYGGSYTGNKIDGCPVNAISMVNSGSLVTNSSVVSGNVFASCGPVHLNATNIVFTGNTIATPTDGAAGLVLASGSDWTTVSGNVIRKGGGTATVGISVAESTALIQGNQIQGWGGAEGATGVINRTVALSPNMATTTASTTNLNRYST